MTEISDQERDALTKQFVNPPQRIASHIKQQVDHYADPNIFRLDPRDVLPNFKNYKIDLWDDQLNLIQAYTNHGKSNICDVFLYHTAKKCGPDDIVVKVSYENTLQQDGTRRLAYLLNSTPGEIAENRLDEQKREKIPEALQNIAKSPIWWVGPNEKTARSFLTPSLEVVMQLLVYLVEKQKKNLKLLVVDHFHAIPIKSGAYSEKRAFSNNVEALTLFPAAFHCPVIVATQSSRDAENQHGIKVPQLWHLANTADLERAARNVLSLWIPLVSGIGYGDAMETKDGTVIVDENLMFMGIMKQKNNPVPPIRPCHMDWEHMQVLEYKFGQDLTEVRTSYKD